MQPTWQDVIEIVQQYKYIRMEYWLNENLFSFGWWVLLVTTIGLFIVWVIILDKKRIFEIITYGLMVAIIAMTLDMLGISLLLWNYPNSLTPSHSVTEIHIVQMPVIYMIVYQYFNKWKTFLIVAAISAFIFALILEPLLEWLQIYKLYQWKFIYSLVPYFVIAVVLKWIINKFKQLDQNYQ